MKISWIIYLVSFVSENSLTESQFYSISALNVKFILLPYLNCLENI